MRKLLKERKLFKGGNYMRKYGKLFYWSQKFCKLSASASNFNSFSESLEQFFHTVDQNNFGNKIPFLIYLYHVLYTFFFYILGMVSYGWDIARRLRFRHQWWRDQERSQARRYQAKSWLWTQTTFGQKHCRSSILQIGYV